MDLQKTFLLSLVLLITQLRGMGDDNYYIRRNDIHGHQVGELLSFPKSMLQDFKLLAQMHEDLYTPDLGTSLTPFQVAAEFVDPGVFASLKEFFTHQRRREAGNDMQKIKDFIWEMLHAFTDRYALLCNFILTGNYLNIDATFMDALKQCIIDLPNTKQIALPNEQVKTETVEDALKGGISRITNKLEPNAALVLKNAIVENLRLTVEQFLMHIVNNHQTYHPSSILEIPNDMKPNIYYTYLTKTNVAFIGFINTHEGRRVNRFSKHLFTPIHPGSNVCRIKKAYGKRIPQYKLLVDLPHQDLLPEPIKFLSKDAKESLRPAYPGPHNIFIHNTASFTAYHNSYYDIPLALWVYTTYIYSSTYKKWVSIPNAAKDIFVFKDEMNQEKLICTVGSTRRQQKIVIIDPQSDTVTVIQHMEDSTITAACLCESLYLYSTQNLENNAVVMHVYDPNQNITVSTPLNQPPISIYSSLIAAGKDTTTLFLFGFGSYQPEGEVHLDIFSIDRKSFKLTLLSSNQKSPFDHFYFETTEKLPSKLFFINLEHTSLKGLEDCHHIWRNETLYMGGFAAHNTRNIFVYEYIPNHAFAMLEALKNFTEYSIEQLYAVGEILNRVVTGTFVKMTEMENELFSKLKDEHQNLILNILDWRKKSIYAPPTRDFTGKKRKASGEPAERDEPPTKKQKTDKDDDRKASKEQ